MDIFFRSSAILRDFRESLPRSTTGAIIYPVYFGGLYFHTSGNLVVFITDDSIVFEDTVFACIPNSEYIIVRKADFSYNEMVAAVNYINNIRSKVHSNEIDHPAARNIASLGVSGSTNRVRVFLLDYTEEQIDLFRRTLLDTPMINFEVHQPIRPIGPDTEMSASTPVPSPPHPPPPLPPSYQRN